MLRISSRLPPRVTSKVLRANGGRRLQSSYSGGGGANKTLFAAAGATSLVAGVVGYSAWSNDNRKGVEKTIPGSKYLLDVILGPEQVPAPPKPSKPEIGLVRRRLEREKKKRQQEEEETTSIVTDSVAVQKELEPAVEVSLEPEPTEEASNVSALTVITTEGQLTSVSSPPAPEKPVSDLEERMAAGEIAQDVENAALSQTLEDLAALTQKEITGALSAAEDAAMIIRQHTEKAYQAIDAGQDKEHLFAAVAELSNKRVEVVKNAQEKIAAAREAVVTFQEQITSGLSSSLTKENKSLIAAEETLGELKYALENIKAIVTESERDGKVVSDYRDLVEAGREQFEAEVRSLLPEVKLGEMSNKLTPDELNLLIAHAHRKVLQLQKQVARQQTLEHDRFKEALTKQREEDVKLLEAKITAELDRQRQQLEVEYKHKMAHLREELEGELRTQLKRQAAAHSDHLADVLYVQEKELETKWFDLLQDKVQYEKNKYLASVAKIQGQLHGLKNALSARADVDKAAYAARELWLACVSLRSALRLGSDGAKSWEEQLKPLGDQIATIRAAAGEGNPYITTVLNAVSEEAMARGVFTEEALRERFMKVDRICKRVSMIGDNGGSLIKYLLSYVQSFLVLNAFEYLPGTEVRDEELAVDSLSTYDILARARYCLDKDDLTQSVRYMNLLRGEPRNVAASWIKEARLTLETRQTADALLAHAAATAVKAL
ncbi:MICOS complex subunit MIC60-like isoform X2 [Homarus americanus]|uniref:MICOS complex subunit MIC60-like isoform X2 n=1 Tax=Homarus americanus TaxID=6706 RepID=UPI001C49746D|nr:MICOS complex subunit MIC60-like isoform X2 [Homarus americanus]